MKVRQQVVQTLDEKVSKIEKITGVMAWCRTSEIF